ncbi:MAG TPA: hypothetical protein VN663_22910 [Ramlibacter sp.]|nr:hypothetical protein [Ramlibacter sp.]
MNRWIAPLLAITAIALPWGAEAACGKITDCPTASTPLSGSEQIVLVQGGVTKKLTVNSLGASLPNAGITQLTGDIAAGPGVGSVVATLPNLTTAGTALKITFNAKGQVTGGTTAACADLSDAGTGCSGSASAVGANPTATAGASAVNGSATTFMRSDGAPALAAASTSTAGIAKLHNVPIAIGWPAALNPNDTILAVINQASTISAIIGSVETATGSAATVSVYKAPSGTACSAGTVLHSGSFNANGTAATNQTLTVTTSTIAAGERLCLQTTGTTAWTGGTGIGTITVFLAPTP